MESSDKKINDKWLILPIILLLAYLIFRLVDQSQMITIFPIDNVANDFSGHMARLYFLDKYGFNLVPDWFNGITPLKFYPPFYYIATLPLYRILNSIQITMFLSLLFLYILGLIGFFVLGKILNFSKIKSLFLFCIFFINPVAIGNFLRLGKIAEMFAWVISIFLISLIFYYKDKKLDKKFLFLFIILYSLLFYTHILLFIVISLFLGCLFFYKSFKEKLIIILGSIISLVLTSFFWYPFIKRISGSEIDKFYPLQWLISPGFINDKIVSFIVPTALLIIFYLYKKSNKERLSFYVPIIIFSALYLTRLAVFIPILNRPTPDTYNLFLILIFTIFFLKLDIQRTSLKFLTYIIIILMIISSFLLTPLFAKHTEDINNTIKILDKIDKKFIIHNPPYRDGAMYSYASIYKNLSTAGGWGSEGVRSSYIKKLNNLYTSINNKDCPLIKNNLKDLNTTYVIAYQDSCKTLNNCLLRSKAVEGNVCLFSIN